MTGRKLWGFMCWFYPLLFTLKAVFRTMATETKPAKAMNAMNRSDVVKRDQVSIVLFKL